MPGSGPKFAEHTGVSDNQLLFGVLESALFLSFSRYGGAARGALGPGILIVKALAATSFWIQRKCQISVQRNALPGLSEGCLFWRENDKECEADCAERLNKIWAEAKDFRRL